MLKGCIIYKQLCTLTYICLLTIYLFCNVLLLLCERKCHHCCWLYLWFCISIIVVLNTGPLVFPSIQ